MIVVKAKTSNEGREGDPFEEEFVIGDDEDPQTAVQRVIDEFNRVEVARYGDKATKRILVELLDGTIGETCQFEKIKMGVEDVYRCKRCGLTVTCGGVTRPKSKLCYPDRVCRICNKELASAKSYERHVAKVHNAVKLDIRGRQILD